MELLTLFNLQRFYMSRKYSDVTVISGDLRLPAHRIILAQHSVYFKRAFLGRFSVASSSVIDLGEDDEPDMIRAMIRFMYGGRAIPYYRLCDDNVIEAMVEMFILADKYDVEGLRAAVCNDFTRKVDLAFSDLVKNISQQNYFITSVVPKMCGPSALPLADKLLQQSIFKLCKMHWASLLLNVDFCALYMTGQLFDSDHTSEFQQYLNSILDESGRPDLNRRAYINLSSTIPEPRNEQCFEAFSDIKVTFGDGQTFSTHKILLAIHSIDFDEMLQDPLVDDCLDLGRGDDPTLIEAMLHEVFDPDNKFEPHDWTTFSADMCALTKKYYLQDAEFHHRHRFLSITNEQKQEPSYPLAIALVCGPGSSKYADTVLPDQAFKSCLEDAKTLVKDNKPFFKMLKAGELFNAKFAGRFAAELAGHITGETEG
ncbi:hypothetical protein QM012_000863 [Aureobasidium pullulans]|uniref:BTB domain-containing protein n=1 Tax=Aureobasidium pullulans TaxID=5580 RepID=A0ABR0TF05_AURPU